MMNLQIYHCDATFSDCGEYRYQLTRRWNRQSDLLAFLMLNPSRATAEISDPTVTRCIGYARAWGYAGVAVYNLFALRSTDPKALKRHADPVGPCNDRILECVASNSGLSMTHPMVVAAWGANGSLTGRAATVMAMFKKHGNPLYCLKKNEDGSPQHPLYLAADLKPMLLEAS